MDFFFVEYRDPLVGLIILTVLIFVVAVANYIWKVFASKDEEQKLEKNLLRNLRWIISTKIC